MKFSETSNGKAILYTAHEHANAASQILMVCSLIKRKLEIDNLTTEFLLEMMDLLDKSCERSSAAIDFMYEKLRADFNEEKKKERLNGN